MIELALGLTAEVALISEMVKKYIYHAHPLDTKQMSMSLKNIESLATAALEKMKR